MTVYCMPDSVLSNRASKRGKSSCNDRESQITVANIYQVLTLCDKHHAECFPCPFSLNSHLIAVREGHTDGETKMQRIY